MLSKSIVLFALSASAVLASPFHRRSELHHHRHHGTGTGTGIRPTGSGSPFPAGNDTNGIFVPTAAKNGELATITITRTVYPTAAESAGSVEEPANFGNAVDVAPSSSKCTTTSVVTETSTNFVTVTAEAADLANTKVIEGNSVAAGAFYGGGSRTWGGGWGGQHQSAASSAPAGGFQPSAAQPSTTFATATRSSGVDASDAPAASSSAASAPASGAFGSKRGISFNDAGLVSAFSGKVSWAYNWASTEAGSLDGVEFVPMMWGKNDVSNFASKVGSATHVLSFNEPDLGEQANIDPQTAAQLHKQAMQGLKGKVQIGSPAITNGDSQSPLMGLPWLKKFFEACAGSCPLDFVAFHWYATADSIEYFKQHVEDVVAVAAANGINKVWLTEFKPEGSASAQAAFMSQAIQYLESNPAVERYAGFMASEGTLLSGGKLNTVGTAYAG